MTSVRFDPDSIRGALNLYTPSVLDPNGRGEAAVAAVIRRLGRHPELLFIERAVSPTDPWSGQVALPGGRRESIDRDLAATAVRETEEETGVVLLPDMQIGRLNDKQGSNRNRKLNLVIGCFVFEHDGDADFEPNYEVADAFWVEFGVLMDTGNQVSHQTDYREQPFPGITIGDGRVLWGLTLGFVSELLELLL